MHPARLFSAFFMAVMALFLAGCSSKPDATIETFYEAAAKADVETATKQISFANVPAGQMVQAKGKVQMIVGEMKKRIDANDGLDSVSVSNVKEDEATKSATAQAKIKYRNGKEQTENIRLVKEDGDWKIRLK